MAEAADRIWAESRAGRWKNGTWSHKEDTVFPDARCFVRADLVPQWLPMETAPRFEDVLVSVDAFVSIGYRKRAEDSGWFCSTTGRKFYGSLDGWQPLPRPARTKRDD